MASMRCPLIVGRDDEVARLSELLRQAREGAGGLAVLLGEPGVGKSRLAEQAASLARGEGMSVVVGRAVQAGSPVALRPLAEVLLTGHRAQLFPETPELAPYQGALAQLVPSWRSRTSVEPRAEPVVVTAEAFLRLVSAAARGRGGLVVVEDVHWADPETLAVLEYLADHLPGEPVRVLLTARRGEQERTDAWLARLAARRAADVLPVARLDVAAVAHMLRTCLAGEDPPQDVVSFLQSRADGLPFLVEELLAGLVDAGALVRRREGWAAVSRLTVQVPFTLAETVRDRMRRLDRTSRRVLEAAAVLGRELDCELLVAMTSLEREDVLAGLRGGVGAQLLVADGHALRFRHALTRDAVFDDLLPVDRAELAFAAARAVEAQGPLDDEGCAQAASLYELAGEAQPAARLLHESALRALARGSLESALAAVERAISLAPPGDTAREAMGVTRLEILALSGAAEDAIASARAILAATRTDDLRASVALIAARAAVAAGRFTEAEEQLAVARAAGRARGGRGMLARIDALAAQAAIGAGQLPAAVALAERALAAAEQAGLAEVVCEALEVVGRARRQNDARAAEAAFERARMTAEAAGLDVWRARALHELGTVDLLHSGRLDRLNQARELALATGSLGTLAVVDFHLATVLWVRARFPEAAEAAFRSADLARRLGLPVLPAALGLLASSAAIVGDVEDLRRYEREAIESTVATLGLPRAHADLVLDPAGAADPELEVSVWGRIRVAGALRAADDDAARAALDRAMRGLRRRPTVPFPMRGFWALLQNVYGEDGEVATAEVRASGADGLRLVQVGLAWSDAVAHGRQGRRAEAAAAYAAGEEEQRGYVEAPWSLHTMRRLVATAALRDGWGEPVGWLREAHAWFEEHGQDQQAARCRALLRAAHVPVPRRGRGDAAVPVHLRSLGVTSREMDVLVLVAGEGLTNAEVARRLCLSPRTVEKHVASLLARTGAASRTELRSAVADLAKGSARPRPALNG